MKPVPIFLVTIVFSLVNTQSDFEDSTDLEITELPDVLDDEQVLLVEDLENEFEIFFNKSIFQDQIKAIILNGSGGNIATFNRSTLQELVLNRTVDKVNWIIDHNDTIERILDLSFREKWQKSNVTKEDVIDKIYQEALEKIDKILNNYQTNFTSEAAIENKTLDFFNQTEFEQRLNDFVSNNTEILNETNEQTENNNNLLNETQEKNLSVIRASLEKEYSSLFDNTIFKQQLKEVIENTTNDDIRNKLIDNLVRNRTTQQINWIINHKKVLELITNDTRIQMNLSQPDLIEKISNIALEKIKKVLKTKSHNIHFTKKLAELIRNKQLNNQELYNLVKDYTAENIDGLLQHQNLLEPQLKFQLIDLISRNLFEKISRNQKTTTILAENTTDRTTNFPENPTTGKDLNNAFTERPSINKKDLVKLIRHQSDKNLKILIKKIQNRWQQPTIPKQELIHSIRNKNEEHLKSVLEKIESSNNFNDKTNVNFLKNWKLWKSTNGNSIERSPESLESQETNDDYNSRDSQSNDNSEELSHESSFERDSEEFDSEIDSEENFRSFF